MSTKLDLMAVREIIADHLDRISRIFTKGAKLTLLVRIPGQTEQDSVYSDDNLDLAIEALKQLASKEKKDGAPQ